MTADFGLWQTELSLLLADLGLVSWLAAEFFFIRGTRRAGAPAWRPSAEDRGSFAAVILSLWIAIAGVYGFFFGPWTTPLPFWLVLPGLASLIGGIALRGWALRVLGRNFSSVVRTTPDQQLVRNGPYRRLRHPAYTANLLVIFGFSLLIPTWPGLGFAMSVVLAAHLYRIRVEEIALRSRFPTEYAEYERGSWRLVPWVY